MAARARSTRSPMPRWCGRATRSAGSGRGGSCRREYRAAERLDAGGGLVIPGLVDCHTHLAFGGWRAEEFEQRIQGRSYLDIARGGRRDRAHGAAHPRGGGGGAARARARAFSARCCALGVTTVECKSGYGLDREHELRLLRVYRRAGGSATRPAGAHLSRRPRGAAGVPRRPRRVSRAARSAMLIPTIAREGLAPILRRLRGALGVHAGRGAAAAPGGAGGAASAPSCTPTSSAPAAAPSSRRSWARSRRITSSAPRRPGSRRWPGPASWR